MTSNLTLSVRHTRSLTAAAVAAALASLAPSVWAESTPQPVQPTVTPAVAEPTNDAALTLGTITVQSAPSGALNVRSVFSSVDILRASVLQDQHLDYSWELLTRAPGV